MDRYDVVIVGAGPAGIFAALELARMPGLKIAIIDKGHDIDHRTRKGDILCGWGGAGAFSDGKLTLSPEIGGQLQTFIPEKQLVSLIQEVDQVYLDFGAPDTTYGTNQDDIENLRHKAALADLKLVPSEVRHMGTDNSPEILRSMRDALKGSVDIRTDTEVGRLITRDGVISGVELDSGEVLSAKYVIVAPGRCGADWLAEEAARLGLKTATNPVDVGVRVELPAPVMEEITAKIYEPKLIYYSEHFDDKVRSFCVCPHGEVVMEESDGVRTVNGHSYARKKTENTNFALLVSTSFTEPFKDPITYGRYLASLANLLSGGVIVQRLGDLLSGRRSTDERIQRGLVKPSLETAVPGDLSFVLPYRYLAAIIDMLKAMDHIAPGVASRHTLLYGVEVKFYSSRLYLTPHLETEVANLFAAGDGAGVTRGLIQASASGLLAARSVKDRLA